MCGRVYMCVLVTCILALFGYRDWGFCVLSPQLYCKCQGKNRKDGARPALFPISCYLCCSVICVFYINRFVLCNFCVQMCTVLHCTALHCTAICVFYINHFVLCNFCVQMCTVLYYCHRVPTKLQFTIYHTPQYCIQLNSVCQQSVKCYMQTAMLTQTV